LNKDELRHLSDIPTRTKPLVRRTLTRGQTQEG
jgi:hypothetical protein